MQNERPAPPVYAWRLLGGLVLLQAMLLLVLATALIPATLNWHRMDLDIYARASGRMLQGLLPYRDFPLEYPPLALVAFVLPRLLTFGLPLEGSSYDGVFGLSVVLWSCLAALALAVLARRQATERDPATTLLVYALFVALLSPLLPWRYDLFPALLTLLAFAALLERRALPGGLLLGLGVAAKLYPVVLVALFAVLYLARGERGALARLLGGAAAGLLLTCMPFLLLAPRGLLGFLSYHELRGLQIESGVGGLICLAGLLGLFKVEPSFNYGAFHLASPVSDLALRLLTPGFVLALGVALLVCFRRYRSEAAEGAEPLSTRLAADCAAVLLVFMLTNKVFSPQYVIWLLPFVPLLPRRQVLLCGLIFALTICLFPFLYDRLLSLQPGPVLLLNLRNLLALGLIPWLLQGDRLARLEHPVRPLARPQGPLAVLPTEERP
jgi:uncharacterized membrane protein